MAPAAYANFDVLIDRSPAGYRARVIQSAAGEAAVDFALPFSQEGLGDFLWQAGGGTRHLGAAGPAGAPRDPRELARRAGLLRLAQQLGLPAQAQLAHRGGSFKSTPDDLRCTARGSALPDSKLAWRGFRVAMHLEERS